MATTKKAPAKSAPKPTTPKAASKTPAKKAPADKAAGTSKARTPAKTAAAPRKAPAKKTVATKATAPVKKAAAGRNPEVAQRDEQVLKVITKAGTDGITKAEVATALGMTESLAYISVWRLARAALVVRSREAKPRWTAVTK